MTTRLQRIGHWHDRHSNWCALQEATWVYGVSSHLLLKRIATQAQMRSHPQLSRWEDSEIFYQGIQLRVPYQQMEHGYLHTNTWTVHQLYLRPKLHGHTTLQPRARLQGAASFRPRWHQARSWHAQIYSDVTSGIVVNKKHTRRVRNKLSLPHDERSG